MNKFILFVLMFLQPVVYAGPVCGNKLTAAESMACCEKGHTDHSGMTLADCSTNSCCKGCEFGKAQTLKRKGFSSYLAHPYFSIFPVTHDVHSIRPPLLCDSDKEEPYLSDPPRLFLLEATFRI